MPPITQAELESRGWGSSVCVVVFKPLRLPA